MLIATVHPTDETARPRSRAEQRRLHYVAGGTGHLGCATCPQRSLCGGLADRTPDFDCLARCCGTPATCGRVCRNNPRFSNHVREIGGFALNDFGPLEPVPHPPLPFYAPILYHGSARTGDFARPWVALPLYRLFSRRTGHMHYADRAALCAEFKITPTARLILTGVAEDPSLEAFWTLSREGRRPILKWLRREHIEMVTAPNYSLFTDRPRWDDLHAMKRILVCAREMIEAGVPCALHPNGRTERDFERWAKVLRRHPEFGVIAYEFATGAGRAERLPQHVAWLRSLAQDVGWPLRLIMRGGTAVLRELEGAFGGTTFLDSRPFLRAVKRKRLIASGAQLHVEHAPTPPGAPLDTLLDRNVTAAQSTLILQLWSNEAA